MTRQKSEAGAQMMSRREILQTGARVGVGAAALQVVERFLGLTQAVKAKTQPKAEQPGRPVDSARLTNQFERYQPGQKTYETELTTIVHLGYGDEVTIDGQRFAFEDFIGEGRNPDSPVTNLSRIRVFVSKITQRPEMTETVNTGERPITVFHGGINRDPYRALNRQTERSENRGFTIYQVPVNPGAPVTPQF